MVAKHKIFISYRRKDSAYAAVHVYDRLIKEFEKENVFKDVDSIPLGEDFKKRLREEVLKCNVFLAIVGEKWLNITDDEGKERLKDPEDPVRIEVEAALERDIPLIPLLLKDVSMPQVKDLPKTMSKFPNKNAQQIRPGRDLHLDLEKLTQDILKIKTKIRHETPDWPNAGIKFLLKFHDLQKMKKKFFSVTEKDKINEEKTLKCYLDLNWHYRIWFENKRSDTISVKWGIYSSTSRDPKFRKLCLKIEERCKKLEHEFIFNKKKIGVETKKRIKILELSNSKFSEEINAKINSFDTVCYPIIKKARKQLLIEFKQKFLEKCLTFR